MKKIILFTSLILLLSGCKSRFLKVEDELTSLGYSSAQLEKIKELNNEEIEYFRQEKRNNLSKILIDERYDESKYSLYKTYADQFVIDDLFYYVSNGYLEKYGDIIHKLYRDRFYIKDNLDLYLEYKDEFSDTRSLVEYVNVGAYKKWYEDYEVSKLSNPLYMIASKLYSIEEYVPENIVSIESEHSALGSAQLNEEAYNAFKEMYEDAKKEGISLKISTGYRSYNFQSTLYNSYLKEDPQELVDTYSSRPGFSDHQTGLACDIRANGKIFDEMNGSLEGNWLKDNGHKYGFIVRYPEGKDSITGYMWESWHMRYVGKEAAIIIYKNDITFDEYYEYYVK